MHHNQIYSSTFCTVKAAQRAVSPLTCILVLTLQCWMYKFMVLTATQTSCSALILKVKVETGPLLLNHYNLMLDYPPTPCALIYLLSLSIMCQAVSMWISLFVRYLWIYCLCLSTTSQYYGSYSLFTTWTWVWLYLLHLIVMLQTVYQWRKGFMVTLACGETVFHSMLHSSVHILKGSSAENRLSEYDGIQQMWMPS